MVDKQQIIKQDTIEKKSDSTLSIIDIIAIFLKNKKKILLITGIFCLISIVLYFFVFDLIYMSTASVKSTGKSGSLLSSLSDFSDLTDLDPFSVGGKSAKELAGYEEILKSRRCIEPLIIKFDLMNIEEYRFMEDAIKDFRENNLIVSYGKLAGVMDIAVYYKDPVIAKEMVDFLLAELDKINIEMNVQNARENRKFIENRYLQSKQDLKNAEDSMKIYQQTYGIAPDLQVKATVQSLYLIESELTAEEVKLDVLKQILSADQPEVKSQEAKVTALKNQVEKIRTSTDLNELLSLGNSPNIVMNYLRLQREIEIQNKILTFILPVYEQAKIEEKRETPTIIILDKPYVAERKTKPKRLTMVLIITFFGFVMSTLGYILLYKWRSFKENFKLSN